MTPGARERVFQEKRRLRAAELFELGVANVVIAEALGVSDSAVDLWKARWEAGGAEALRSLGRPGYPCLLDGEQVGRLVAELERGALAHGYDNDRWTAPRVNVLIESLFGVCFADPSGAWRLLRRIGWTFHRPGRRATQRDEQAIRQWRELTWPDILARTRNPGAWVVFEDEAAVMLCPPVRGTWAPRGVVPVLRYSAARGRKTSMAAFVCYRRGRLPRLFYALIEDGSFTEDEFGPLLEQLHAGLRARRVILVWDRLSAHVRSRKTKAFLAANAGWLAVEPLPGYAPELNPVEQLWAWVKNGPLAQYCAPTLSALTDTADRTLASIRRRPELFTAFLHHAGLDWA